jgi:hypothetical protein
MDPRTGPVTLQINATLAQLLVRLMVDANTEDPSNVLSRALGLYDLALHARRGGRKLVLYNEASGEIADVPV